jgi:hypothetical protein
MDNFTLNNMKTGAKVFHKAIFFKNIAFKYYYSSVVAYRSKKCRSGLAAQSLITHTV